MAATGIDTELVARRDAEGTRTMGAELVAALVASAEERGVTILASSGVDDLRRTDDGWAVCGPARTVTARAVVLASGGFEWNPNIPAWLVVDAGYVARHSIGGTPAGQVPEWATSADSLACLAAACGIDPAGLAATVAAFNRHAADGRDPEFRRGESAQDRYLGDPRRPHPCLAPLEEGPYHAIPIRPGTLGTCGGLVTDDDGGVLDRAGRPVGGLFAAGNVSATVFADAYPGGGATLGSAVTRAFAVGRALATHL
jgi:hypothetical protein